MTTSRLVLVSAVLAFLAACAAPVDVRRADVADVYRESTSYALNDGKLSDDVRVTLERAGLDRAFDDDPVDAVRRMHALALAGDRRDRLYALSEMCVLAAEQSKDRRLHLASAVYADLFLFGGGPEPPPGPFDERFRRACSLYGVGLARAFSDDEVDLFQPPEGLVLLPVGAVEVAKTALPLRIGDIAFDKLHPAVGMRVEGFRARDVRWGIGAPLVARRQAGTATKESHRHIWPNSAFAVTAFLRIDGDLEDLSAGTVRGRLEFHRPTETRDVVVNGRTVPLEFDVTAPLAWELAESKPWKQEFSAFLMGDRSGVKNRVFLTEPYQPGRVPVVFVHGTASSPARWAEIMNELADDPLVAERCQFWLYQYDSAEPVLVSADGLRRGLDAVVRDVDPQGKDDALRRMVLVGHSQGGLLVRLMTSASGDRFWRTISATPFDSLAMKDAERDVLRPVFFFEPSPYVARDVFLATPHRGSYVAGGEIGSIVDKLISLPKSVLAESKRLAKIATGAGASVDLDHFSTAVDDMAPGSAFLGALDACPIAPSVPLNSIVAVEGGAAHESDSDAGDGVVRFVSAHLPSAESEIVVDSPHSCQGHPAVVAEIRRVLREHLAVKPPAPAEATPAH